MDKKKRLLIIDDEPLIRSTLSDYLTECGYETATARDGAEGLKAARAQEFDAVLVTVSPIGRIKLYRYRQVGGVWQWTEL